MDKEASPPSPNSQPEMPAWAQDFPNFWEDEALKKQANGDAEYLDLLAWRETARLRTQALGTGANQEALDYYMHKSNAVRGYEQAKGITLPDEN